MRKNAKRLASAVIAAMMVASLSITVLADDYSSGGTTAPEAPSSSSSATQDEISDAVSKPTGDGAGSSGSGTAATTSNATVNSDIANAIGSPAADSEGGAVATVTVKSTQNLKVNSSVVKQLAASNGTVLKIVSPKAVISIDSSTIKKARKIDLSMKIANSATRTTINMSSKKDFGCEVKITVTSCKMSDAKLAKAHVYLGDEDLGQVDIDENGNPVITVTKGGKYIIK